MHRPRLLVAAARHFAQNYLRHLHCPASLRSEQPAKILTGLTEGEARLEVLRGQGSPAYKPAAHVQFLGALIAEHERGHAIKPPRPKRPLKPITGGTRYFEPATPETEADAIADMGLKPAPPPFRRRRWTP